MLMKLALTLAAGLAAAAALPAKADVLDVPARKARAERPAYGSLPARGLSMAQVERRYGAPIEKLPPAGGDAPRHPTINRWRYPGYTVYFERSRVIHSVPDAAAASPAS
jgi:hypothetical protein